MRDACKTKHLQRESENEPLELAHGAEAIAQTPYWENIAEMMNGGGSGLSSFYSASQYTIGGFVNKPVPEERVCQVFDSSSRATLTSFFCIIGAWPGDKDAGYDPRSGNSKTYQAKVVTLPVTLGLRPRLRRRLPCCPDSRCVPVSHSVPLAFGFPETER